MPETEVKERTAGHTPLPWIVNGDKFQVEHWPTSFSGDHRVIALCATGDGAMANAMLIVKAVNSFPKLVALLREAQIYCPHYPGKESLGTRIATALSEAEDTGEGRATLDSERSNTKEG